MSESKAGRALIIVDIQNDFCPGGSLAVEHADEIVPIANSLAWEFKAAGDLVVATRDVHPADHGSFASVAGVEVGTVGELGGVEQVFWPDHCVEGTPGADYHPGLDYSLFDAEFVKGTDRMIDSYSGFYDNDHQTSTGLAQYLRNNGIEDVTVIGLATDFCVAATARDAIAEGFRTTVVAGACRGVDLAPGDSERTLAELEQLGVKVV